MYNDEMSENLALTVGGRNPIYNIPRILKNLRKTEILRRITYRAKLRITSGFSTKSDFGMRLSKAFAQK